MSDKSLPKSIFIDALALVPAKKSGVGQTLENTFTHLISLEELDDYTFYLVVPLGKAKYLTSYLQAKNVKIKTIFLPARVLQALLRLSILLPIDWFLGKGLYIFPNYQNWPLWRSRSLTYIYDVSFIRFPETVKPNNRRYLQRYIDRWVYRADKIITITEHVKTEIEKYLYAPAQQIDVVYCGVNSTLFYRRSAAEIKRAKQKYKIDFEHYLLFVGSIEPRKNLVKLLDAYAQLPTAQQQAYGLVIVGGDAWLDNGFYKRLHDLQQRGISVQKIDQYVASEDLPALYSGATLLIHPAIYEGFGIPPLEAMACQTPVAISRIPAIQEVVLDNGHYFDPTDVADMTRVIKMTLLGIDSVTQKTMLATAKQRAKELSWQSSANQLADSLQVMQSRGAVSHPLLRRLKHRYVKADQMIRQLLGEKAQKPYRPKMANNQEQLRKIVADDFAREQQSALQHVLLKIYVRSRYTAALIVKAGYRQLKAVR